MYFNTENLLRGFERNTSLINLSIGEHYTSNEEAEITICICFTASKIFLIRSDIIVFDKQWIVDSESLIK